MYQDRSSHRAGLTTLTATHTLGDAIMEPTLGMAVTHAEPGSCMNNDENDAIIPELVDSWGVTPDFDINFHDEGAVNDEPPIVCSEPPAITITDNSLFPVMAEDAKVAKTVLNNLKVAWKQAKTIDQVCKLSLTTMKVLEQRRNLMNLQLGMLKTFAGGSTGGMGPYDA